MFNNNKVNFIISLVAAIALWFYVVGQVDPKTEKRFTDVPIQLINSDSLSNDGLAVADMDYEKAVVILEGNRADLNAIEEDDIKVTADLKDLHKGTNTVTLKASVPRDAEVASLSPETVDIRVEERVTESKPVEVRFKGDPGESLEPGNVSVTPDNVQVTGAETTVAKVESVVATVDIDDIIDSGRAEAKVKPVGKDGKRVSNVDLSVNTVEVSAEMMSVKEVTLNVETVGEVAEGMQVEEIKIPKTVFIKGEQGYVDDISEVSAADVDISSAKETTEFPLDIYLPSGIELADKSKDVSVTVVLKNLSTHEFEISSSKIVLVNAGDGLVGAVEEKTIKVTVEGKDSVLETLTEDDLRITADLSGLGTGTQDVAIKVECDKAVDSIKVSPKKIGVTIREE